MKLFEKRDPLLPSEIRLPSDGGDMEPAKGNPQRGIRYWIVAALQACACLIIIFEAYMATRPHPPYDSYFRPGKGGLLADPAKKQSWTYDEIVPSTDLKWYPCQSAYRKNFFCAKLRVPMDYHRPFNDSESDNPAVDIALIMLPAKSSGGATWSPSPMLFNPGGPGGSGVDFLSLAGEALQNIVGHDFDLVSFDPRGIGLTTPDADCFAYPSSGKEPSYEDKQRAMQLRMSWMISGASVGLFNYTDHSAVTIDSRNRALAAACAEKDALQGEDSILRHIATPNVARDLLSIIDAWTDWTAKMRREHPEQEAVFEKHPQREAQGKLVYWGFSYGTLLGATFASMFPDRVHRVMLDGVVDADHYVSPVWSESIINTNDILSKFCTYCHEAEKDCALFRNGDSKSDVCTRVDKIMEELRERPLYGVSHSLHTPGLIEYSMIKSLMFSILYAPINGFPVLASWLSQIGRAQSEGGLPFNNFALDLLSTRSPGYGWDAQQGIMCGDKRYALNDTIPALYSRFNKLSKNSTFADVWMTAMDTCSGWSIPIKDPPMRWDDHPSHAPKPIKTSFPLLFLSNTFDPVTPLFAGHLMAHKFVDAGLVELKTEGHCTLAAHSQCTFDKIRAYLKGEVPRAPGEWKERDWVTCEADERPWKPYRPLSEEDLWEGEDEDRKAWRKLQRVLFEKGEFGWGRNRLLRLTEMC